MKKTNAATCLAVVALTLALTANAAPAGKGNQGNPGILPPQSNPHGMSYAEWSAKHWQWVYSMPINNHPMYDTSDCDAGQSGPVWFLGGTLAASLEGTVWVGRANRNCTVPVGKMIFFPILDSECSVLEGNGTTEQDLRDCAVWIMNHVTSLSCEIDGVPVKNLEQYRVQSPLFTYGPLPENNVLAFWGYDAPAGATSAAVSDGVFLMLAPLSAGQHTIHIGGSLVIPEWDNYSFVIDVTYHLTVQPGKKK